MRHEITLKQTAQAQIAQALAEVFEGRTFRYWKNGNDTWFVAKDLVEAAEGNWHPQNFKNVVGDGAWNSLPIPDSMGRAQDTIVCSAKTAVRWLSVARPPRGEALADLVFDIIGRVMDPRNKANHDWKGIELANHDGCVLPWGFPPREGLVLQPLLFAGDGDDMGCVSDSKTPTITPPAKTVSPWYNEHNGLSVDDL